MGQAAELAVKNFTPNGTFNMTVTWPAGYDLTDKDTYFKVRKDENGPVLFQATESGTSYITVSGQDVVVAVPWDATNEISGGNTLQDILCIQERMEYSLDLVADSDTDTVLYRLQGWIRYFPQSGPFPE